MKKKTIEILNKLLIKMFVSNVYYFFIITVFEMIL
jgi:hypothetical protein